MSSTQPGYTILEIVIATVIIGLAVVGVGAIFVTVAEVQETIRNESLATFAAESKIEDLRNTSFYNIPESDPLTSPAITFTSELPDELPAPKTGEIYVEDLTTRLKDIEVVITYTEDGQIKEFKFKTLLAIPGLTQ